MHCNKDMKVEDQYAVKWITDIVCFLNAKIINSSSDGYVHSRDFDLSGLIPRRLLRVLGLKAWIDLILA